MGTAATLNRLADGPLRRWLSAWQLLSTALRLIDVTVESAPTLYDRRGQHILYHDDAGGRVIFAGWSVEDGWLGDL